jgi:hypothetical protein
MTTRTKTSYAELNAILVQARRPSATPVQPTDEQLLGLQHRWTTALSARLDEVLEFSGTEPLIDAVAQAWRELAAQHDTLRALLDAGESRSSALAQAQQVEFQMLALASGLSGLGDPSTEAARLGRAFRDLIRSGSSQLTPELARVA